MLENVDGQVEQGLGIPRNGLDQVKLENIPVDHVQAELVVVQNSLVQHISSTEAEIVQSGVFQVDGDRIEIHQGGAGLAQTTSLQIQQGGVGVAQADQISVTGLVGLGVADRLELDNSQAGLLLANEIHTTGSRSVFMLAGHIDGPVETVLDTPRTILAGLVAGVAVGLVLMVGNLLTRRRRI